MGELKTVYRVARTRQELEQAFALVYQEYRQRGYIPQGYKSALRLSFYNALPATTTFVALRGDRVAATLTLVPDSPLGVPMDKLYRQELDELRAGGARLTEVSQLAVDADLFGTSLFSLFNFDKLMFVFGLFKVMLAYALQAGVTDLCIAINPKQQHLYKFLLFRELGGLKSYGEVNQAPAIAFRLEIQSLEEQFKRNRFPLYKIFYQDPTAPDCLQGKLRLAPQDLAYLFVERSDLFARATPEQLAHLTQCYPSEQEALERLLASCHNGNGFAIH